MRQARDAAAHRVADVNAVAEPAASDHVATLLIVRVGVEQIVGDVLENFLQPCAGHAHAIDVRIANCGRVMDVLYRDRGTREDARAPAESGRERYFSVALLNECITDQIVESAGEISAPVEQRLSAPDLARKLSRKRRADFC